MKTLDFLMTLRERDIHVWAEGDRLRCNAPAGALSEELRRELQLRKDAILQFLRSAESLAQQQRAIIPIQPTGTAAPVYAVAGHNGDVFCFRALARKMGADQPFFGLQPPGLDGHLEPLRSVERLAAYFADQIRAARPDGPYVIGGYCAGGTIAIELARHLLQQGALVSRLVLFGSPFPTSYRLLPRLCQRLEEATRSVARHSRALATLPATERRKYFSERWHNFKKERAAEREAARDPVVMLRNKVGRATLAAIRRYVPGLYHGRLCLFWPGASRDDNALKQWASVARHTEFYLGPAGCNGATMLSEEYAAAYAELFRRSERGECKPDKPPVSEQPLAPPPPGKPEPKKFIAFHRNRSRFRPMRQQEETP